MTNKWVDRVFEFDFPVTAYPGLMQRLRETPDRLETIIRSIPQKLLTIKDSGRWSIQENAGHLLTVEELFAGRLSDYENKKAVLRPADVSGSRTNQMNYNSGDINDILQNFRAKRMIYIARLESVDSELFAESILHPRLNKPMRLCDMLFFQAEHDEHHIRKIEVLGRKLISTNRHTEK